MDSRTLIAEIYKSRQLEELIKKIRPIDIQEDLRQHLFLTLLEKPEAFILELHSRGKLQHYVVSTLFNLVRWQTGTFNKTKLREVLVEELPELTEEIQTDAPVVELERLYWYEARMLELYAEHRSYRKIEALTGINYVSVFNTIKKARANIKKLIKYE